MDERELILKIGQRLEELEKQGLTETQEYEDLSADWQDLAHNYVLGEMLDEDNDSE